MKTLKRLFVVTGIVAALLAIPTHTASAFWYGPAYGPWRHSYIYDPAYRWGSPVMKSYLRDLYLRGPGYAQWNQSRRYGWW